MYSTAGHFECESYLFNQNQRIKVSQNNFFPFNFAITEICAAIHLTEDETRMGGI